MKKLSIKEKRKKLVGSGILYVEVIVYLVYDDGVFYRFYRSYPIYDVNPRFLSSLASKVFKDYEGCSSVVDVFVTCPALYGCRQFM